MSSKIPNTILAFCSVMLSLWAIDTAVSYPSAFVLRRENQSEYTSRRGSRISGVYLGGYWQASPSRGDYPEFRGGGLNAGK